MSRIYTVFLRSILLSPEERDLHHVQSGGFGVLWPSPHRPLPVKCLFCTRRWPLSSTFSILCNPCSNPVRWDLVRRGTESELSDACIHVAGRLQSWG